MVPDIAAKGHSFKGAMAYYLHDKGQDAAGAHLTTAERVAWTETRNLATDDPQLATRIMIATAKDADRLKAEAGIKNTGRKSTAHVYAYSLAWHPDEAAKLDRAEMVRAADSSLKALGADHLQAVIICHQEREHPHVHIVLNRVDPANGKMHAFSNDRLILSDWANAYERERGHILTPLREEKRQLRQQFTDQAARREHVQAKERTPSPASMLKEFGDAQKVAHRQQWIDLAAQHKAAKEAVYADYGARIAAAAAEHKAASKPLWAQHFREARAQQAAFAARESTITGRLRNALDAAKHQMATGQAAPDRGVLSLTFANALSSQARAAALTQQQDSARAQVAATTRAQLDARIEALKAERAAALSRQREAHTKARADLISRQDGERAKIREAWKQLNQSRAEREPGATFRHRKSTPIPVPPPRNMSRADRVMERTSPTNQRYQRRLERHENRGAELAAKKQARAPAPQPEPKTMKDRFNPQGIPTPSAAPIKAAPMQTVKVSTPAPAPAPAGAPRSPVKTPAQVPAVDRAAAWAKTEQGQAAVKRDAPPASPRKDWSKTAAPPQTSQQVAPRKDWSAAAAPREIKPLAQRDKSRDYDRER